jgi:hypothetical protein
LKAKLEEDEWIWSGRPIDFRMIDTSSRTERTRAKVSAGWNGDEIVLVGGTKKTERVMIANV